MAIRVIAICDGAPSVADRGRLPTILSEALHRVTPEAQWLGFETKMLEPSRWVWDWNPDFDGSFAEWLLGKTVGLSWPNAEGIAVVVSKNASCVSTGVRWDSFTSEEQVQKVVMKIVSAIGRSLGARKTWLVPDAGDPDASKAQSLFFEGASSADLAATLRDSASTRSVEC